MPRTRTTFKKARTRITPVAKPQVAKRRKSTNHVRRTVLTASNRLVSVFKRIWKSTRFRTIATYTTNKLSSILIIVGLVVLFAPVFTSSLFESSSDAQSAPDTASPSASVSATNFGPIHINDTLLTHTTPAQPPQRIIIPSVSIDLVVKEARLVNGYWETSETTASHGLGSAYPGQNGNVVIFAHARDGLFAPIRTLKNDARVYVLTNDRWHEYRVKSIRTVAPNETQVIGQTDTETLTLFTCTGFLDSKRLVVTATPNR